ncbi:Aste57867_16946 [Aphanomyces stellatus]|uniref:Aste57867_16946 protein n=1 Tax=Aphanomyces stellatus TaxID=120398 RepID=A0A485L6M5_9STRA|nr:hypothetical protein As57867_016888 [Aphanomyces stellatus]VFT93708.1 Aste57867_16946 [Aphanomyces stellatus]
MTSNLSYSDLLMGNNNELEGFTNDIVQSSRKATDSEVKKTAGLKRSARPDFQKKRSNVFEFIPGIDDDRWFEGMMGKPSGEATTTTFMTPHGEEERQGLGLDLESLMPTESPDMPDPIPFKEEDNNAQTTNNQIDSIPDLLDIGIPAAASDAADGPVRRGHMHRNSVELTQLSQQFGAVLQPSAASINPMMQHGYPTSPVGTTQHLHRPLYPSSPVNSMHMPSPMHHSMMLHQQQQQPGSPVLGPMMMQPGSPMMPPGSPVHGGMMPMIPISLNYAPMNSMYSYDPTMLHHGMVVPSSPALSTGMSEQFGQFGMSVPNSPCASDASDKKEAREKREYKCRQCGQPKSGHVCTSIKSMMDSAVQHETTASNTSEWRILRVKTKWVSSSS